MQLRAELEQLKCAHVAADEAGKLAVEETMAAPPSPKGMEGTPSPPAFDQLTSCEQAAGSLSVHPEAWRPIKFMNNAHYDNLMKSNSIDDTLARRIEAFRVVSTK